MVHIRRIVKTTQIARNRLQAEIAPRDVADFKKFIANSIETIKRLCADGRMTLSQCTFRIHQSRAVGNPHPLMLHYFLKAIDLDNLL